MKTHFRPAFCLFFAAFLLSGAVFPQEKTEDTAKQKIITIHSVRVMEIFKKENNARWTKKKDSGKTDSAEKKPDEAGKTKQDTGNGTTEDTALKKDTPDSVQQPANETVQPPTDTSAQPLTNDTAEPLTGDTAEPPVETAEKTAAETTIADAQSAVDSKKTQDQIIVFSGGVSISVKDGSSISSIKADSIVFNRSENIMEAAGNVHYSRKAGSAQAEEFFGELLLFNIDELEGVFIDGTLRQPPRKKKQSPFVIRSNTVGRDSSGTTGFKNAVLSTGSVDDDPLWSITSSRLWLLPGSELAFVNGYFSIGVVPIFYLPFFYHPADEMLFHPVFGFRNRQGAFIQTTTYLLGRKVLEKSEKEGSSFSNFLLGSDTLKKQKRHGVFLKNLDEDETKTEPTYLKLVADSYALLGGLVGIDGKFVPKNNPVKQVEFSLYFGMSRTLYPPKGKGKLIYTAYDENGERHYNRGFFYQYPVPFRYRGHFSMNISKNPVQFSVTMDLPSDPFFKKDFFDRAENMNWFNYALNQEKLAKGNDISRETSYSWKINSSIRPSIKEISPWINSLSLNNASLLVDFSSKANTNTALYEKETAPHREFFYPRIIKPEGRISIAGTLLSNTLFKPKKSPEKKQEFEGIPNPFHQQDDTEKTALQSSKPDFMDTFVPALKPAEKAPFDHSLAYSLTYNGNINVLQETIFSASKWNKPEDIRWNDHESRYYQIRGEAGLKGSVSYAKNLLSYSGSLIWKGNYQKHPFVSNTASAQTLGLNDFKANVYTLKNEHTVSVNPFTYTDMLTPVAFKWNFTGILAKTTFTGTYGQPNWKTERIKWDKDFITAHTASSVFGLILAEKYTQTLTFSANLPPVLGAYSTALSLDFPYGKFTASARLFEKEKAQKRWYWDPFKAEIKWSFPYQITASQAYTYNIEDKNSDRLHLTFGWKYFSAFYTHSREIPYKLQPGSGWIPDGTEKKFIPFAAGFSFSNTSSPFTIYAWKNRIKLQASINSSLQMNLIRITDSYFTFSPKVIFNIHEFWDISFGSTSRNAVLARYFQSILNLPVTIPGNTNIFTDLAHSFYFWDTQKREQSGFKLQSLDIGVTHYLKDWVMKFDCKIKPEQKKDGNRIYYDFVPVISFAVEWNPITDIKVTAKKKEGVFSVDRGEIK